MGYDRSGWNASQHAPFACPTKIVTELEVHLREHSHKIRVTEKLSGAHLVFPSESSLAVRVYYPADLEALRAKIAAAEESNTDVDVDGLAQFSAKFRNAMVIVVLPEDGAAADDSESVTLEHLQHILETTEATHDNAPPRTFVVRSTQHAVEALTSVADSLRPSATNLKVQYLKRQEQELDPFNSTGLGLAAWLLKHQGIEHKEAELLQSLASNVDSLVGNELNVISCDARIKHLVRSLFESMPENADAVSVTPSSITPDASPPLLANPVDPAMTLTYEENQYVMAPLPSHVAADHRHQYVAAFPSTPHHMIYYQHPEGPPTYVVRGPPSRLQASALLVHPRTDAAYGTPALASHHFVGGGGGGGRFVGLDPNSGGYVAHPSATQGVAPAAGPAQLVATVHPRGGTGSGGGTLATPHRAYRFPPM
jgi:hypothetical protein